MPDTDTFCLMMVLLHWMAGEFGLIKVPHIQDILHFLFMIYM